MHSQFNNVISAIETGLGKAAGTQIGRVLGADILQSGISNFGRGHYRDAGMDVLKLMLGGSGSRVNSSIKYMNWHGGGSNGLWSKEGLGYNLGRAAARGAAFHGAIGLGYGALSGQGMLRHGFRGAMSPVRMPANAILGTDW